jgi:hypothetical protein
MPARSRLRRSALLLVALLLSSCAREAPDVREARKATQEYLKALERQDVKEIGDRSTCVVSTNSLTGARVLAVGPSRWVRMGDLDSLVRVGMTGQTSAEAAWANASDATADSLFLLARLRSNEASVYRNAVRAVPLSAPGVLVARDSTLEVRSVRARFRYAGAVIGPKPVDREEMVHLLRAPRGKWIVFSVYLRDEDPTPELGRPERV